MYAAAIPILTGIRVNPEVGAAQVAVSDAGAFGYLSVVSTQRTLVWVDRQGKETAVAPRPEPIPFLEWHLMARALPSDVWEGRLLLVKDSTAEGVRPGREIVVVQNWLEELVRLVPVKQP